MHDDKSPDSFGRFFPMLAIVFLTFSWLGVSSVAAVERIVTVGVYENAPKIFTTKSGKPAGIYIDIIEEIAEKERWTLRYRSGTWEECLESLHEGKIDLMPDVAYTAKRANTYAFNRVPVLSAWSQVYARKGNHIRSILDMNGKRIATLGGSVQQEEFTRLVNAFELTITLIPTPDYKTTFQMVAKNGADAAISNNFFGRMHAKEYGLEDTAVVFSPYKLHFAAPRHDPNHLLATIDRHLAAMKEDPRSVYYRSLRRWTAEEVHFKLPAWVQITGLVAGLALLFSILGAIILKHQVNLRTRELRQINQEMERRIVERTEELAEAMERAQSADRLKSAFLATMSHELRTPLNSIIGFTGILLQGLAGALNDEQKKQMSMVQGSARHLLALINDVLDISKIEAGQLQFALSSFDLKASIEKTVKLAAPLAEKKGIALGVDIPGNLGEITADQRRVEQVILNLLSNAVKFTEKGRITVACRDENDQFVVSVADTGTGMQPEEIPNIFQPFHQIDTGLTRRHEGTGLGLSISKKIVDMMGGAIIVESRPGEGSVFTVRLPKTTGDLS